MNYSYYYPEDYLTHHGVKGMKWGVRRYRNADGSLTADGRKRLHNYKQKEIARNAKKYDSSKDYKKLSKLETKLESARSNGNVNRAQKLDTKVKQTKTSINYSKAMKKLENSRVMNMSYSQMQKEKNSVRKAHAQAAVSSVLETALISAVLVPTAGYYMVSVRTANTGAVKTNSRTTSDERKNVMYESARKAYDR